MVKYSEVKYYNIVAFADIEDNMVLAEEYLKFCVQYILENNFDELEYFQTEQIRRAQQEKKPEPPVKLLDNLKHVFTSSFQKVTYEEALNICIKVLFIFSLFNIFKDEKEGKVTFERKLAWGVDMSSEHERYLAEYVFKSPVIIYNHPKEFKAFYMRLNNDKRTVASMDVIVPGVIF